MESRTEKNTPLKGDEESKGAGSQPFFSVILPVFNIFRAHPRYAIEAIESVRNQTFKDFELIIVNDGSTDNSEKICLDFISRNPEMNVRYYIKDNGGQSSARNFGAQKAQGTFLCFIDQDDIWTEYKLKLIKPFLGPDLDLIYTDADSIDHNSATIFRGIHRNLGSGMPHPKNSIEDILFRDIYVMPGLMAIKKETFFRINGFDENLSGYEDDDLFLRIFEIGKIKYLPFTTLKWRIHGGNYSNSPRMIRSRLLYWEKLIKGYTQGGKDSRRVKNITYRFFREFIYQAISLHECKNDLYQAMSMYENVSELCLENLRGARKIISFLPLREQIVFQSYFFFNRKRTMDRIKQYFERKEKGIPNRWQFIPLPDRIKTRLKGALNKSLYRFKDLIYNNGSDWFKELYLHLTGIKDLRDQVQRLSESIPSHLNRGIVARMYLKGTGVEIGAMDGPLNVPDGVKVRYIDRKPIVELMTDHYPGLELVNIDIIGDGETLGFLKDASQDFVIANHLLEHCQNPIAAVRNMLRVLKSNGILYLAVPDKLETFDANRPVTPMEHLLRDYEEGPQWSRRQHFQEWVQLVENVTDQNQAKLRLNELLQIDYSVHFHVWTQAELFKFFSTLKETLCFPFEIEFGAKREYEMIFVLRKTERGTFMPSVQTSHAPH